MNRMMLGATTAVGLVAAGGLAAAPPFAFDPMPRWAEEQETEIVCAAIRAECPGLLKEDQIDAEWGYAEVYNADGKLVGLRSTKSTTCRPLDEHLLLGQRKFRTTFTDDGDPDLEGIKVELAPGTPRDAVRLVRDSSTSLSLGC